MRKRADAAEAELRAATMRFQALSTDHKKQTTDLFETQARSGSERNLPAACRHATRPKNWWPQLLLPYQKKK